MKKIANGILADNPEENVVFMTEDNQGFFDLVKATNHADKNEFSEPEAFYREGYEPEDVRALEEQLVFAQEENETLTGIVVLIEQAVDFTQDAPEVTQETNAVVAAVVQLREKFEAVQAEQATLEETLSTVQSEKETLATSLLTVQTELDTLKAIPVDVVAEPVTPVVPIAPKKAK